MARTTISKVAETLFIFWGFMFLSLVETALGPSLLDLQLLINSLVDNLSYVFLAEGICVITGNILAAVVFPNVNTRLKLAIVFILGSVINSVITAVDSYPYFLFIYCMHGLSVGFAACYLLQVCNTLWKQKGVAFQFTICGGTVGAILTPVIVKSFLCIEQQGTSTGNTSTGNGSDVSRACQADDTRVQYAYVVLGLITVPCGIGFLYFWKRMRTEAISEAILQYETLSSSRQMSLSSRKLKYAYMAVLFFFEFPVVGIQAIYSTYLTAFGVEGPLHISKGIMVYMTTVLYVASLTGNVINSLLFACFGNFKVILVNLLCFVVTGAIIISLADKYETVLWICTIAFGLFSGCYEVAILAWTETFMEIDIKLITLSRTGTGAGITVITFVGGLLYRYVPPVGHLYLIFALIIFMCVMFLLLNVIGRCMKKER